MKKIVVAIIAVLYMGVSSGIAMQVHYCMGKNTGMDFYSNHNDKCGKCGMKAKPGCCNEQHKFVKLQDAHKNVSGQTAPQTTVTIIFTAHNPYHPYFLSGAKANIAQNHSPPEHTGPSARIMNCVFRI